MSHGLASGPSRGIGKATSALPPSRLAQRQYRRYVRVVSSLDGDRSAVAPLPEARAWRRGVIGGGKFASCLRKVELVLLSGFVTNGTDRGREFRIVLEEGCISSAPGCTTNGTDWRKAGSRCAAGSFRYPVSNARGKRVEKVERCCRVVYRNRSVRCSSVRLTQGR